MYQVNYEAKYIAGQLIGKLYHRHITFDKKSEAIFFTKGDGLQIFTPELGTYIQQNSEIVNLTNFLK